MILGMLPHGLQIRPGLAPSRTTIIFIITFNILFLKLNQLKSRSLHLKHWSFFILKRRCLTGDVLVGPYYTSIRSLFFKNELERVTTFILVVENTVAVVLLLVVLVLR